MKKICTLLISFSIVLAMLAPVSLFAQKEDKDVKETKEKKEAQQIVITRRGGNDKKLVVEINGENITVNGKPLSDLKDMDIDINVRLNKLKDMESLTFMTPPNGRRGNMNENKQIIRMYKNDDNRPMLGVISEKADEGAKVQSITKESAAEKMGLKEGDIITKIDDKKVEGPDDLAEAIKTHKPGDKVNVTFLRNKKELKATGELSAWKGMDTFSGTGSFDMKEMDIDIEHMMPRIESMPGMRAPLGGQNWSWAGGAPKLGISVQDTDDGKGVKVIEVEEESNAAKAGIKEDDIITQVDDKAVNAVDEIAKMIREKKDNPSAKFQITRNGKSQTIEVKMPRKIRTADL